MPKFEEPPTNFLEIREGPVGLYYISKAGWEWVLKHGDEDSKNLARRELKRLANRHKEVKCRLSKKH